MVMKTLLRSIPLVLAGVLLGFVFARVSGPRVAYAQTTASPAATLMQGGMMNGGATTDCPTMSGMMQSVHGPADRMMMNGMMSMHQSMAALRLSGDPDKDFMAMMIPHHQAAIDMAKAELQYGKDPRVLTLAKNIIAAQQNEIAEMQAWLK